MRGVSVKEQVWEWTSVTENEEWTECANEVWKVCERTSLRETVWQNKVRSVHGKEQMWEWTSVTENEVWEWTNECENEVWEVSVKKQVRTSVSEQV